MITLKNVILRRSAKVLLDGASVTINPGEKVGLVGRNGAGKSTFLRLVAGLLDPTRGSVQTGGRVALLLQNPNDYFVRERVDQETSTAALAAVGLESLGERNPRDLSGGERQRLALAIVAPEGDPGEEGDRARREGKAESREGDRAGGKSDAEAGRVDRTVVLALDEPTRGMDREAKAALAAELRRRAEQGQAVIVATHDPEFAAACAERAILLADGRVIADSPTAELLVGGWYFSTETARILGGEGEALEPEAGAELLAERASRLRPATGARVGAGETAASPHGAQIDSALVSSFAPRGEL